MRWIKSILLNLCLFVFFAQAVYSLLLEGKENYLLFKQYSTLSDDHKRYNLIGERYSFALKCGSIIPMNACILYLSNLSNNQESFDLFLNYLLYPRRLYWLNNVDPYPESPPDLKDLDLTFLSERNIKWILFNYPKGYGVRKAVYLDNCSVVKSFHLD